MNKQLLFNIVNIQHILKKNLCCVVSLWLARSFIAQLSCSASLYFAVWKYIQHAFLICLSICVTCIAFPPILVGKDRRLNLFKKPTNKQIGHLLQYGHKMTMIKLNLCWKKLTVVSKKSTDNWNLYKQVWMLCTAWATIIENKLAAWKLSRLNASTQPVMWDANNMSYCTLRRNGALGGCSLPYSFLYDAKWSNATV